MSPAHLSITLLLICAGACGRVGYSTQTSSSPLGPGGGPANPTVCGLTPIPGGMAGQNNVTFKIAARDALGNSVDFDRDGNNDFVTANLGGDVGDEPLPLTVVHLGNGDGTFEVYSLDDCDPTTPASDSWTVIVADLNRDGRQDVILGDDVSDGGSIGNCGRGWPPFNRIFYGNGDGTFQTPQPVPRHPTEEPVAGDCSARYLENMRDYAIGDEDGDGHPDLMIGGDGSVTRLWTIDGDGALTAIQSPFGAGDTFSVELGDLDSDGRLDLVVGRVNQDNQVFLGQGAGAFGAELPFNSLDPATFDLELADIDRDGNLDLFEISGDVGSYALGNGDGTFNLPGVDLVAPGASGVATADMNGDCLVDAVISRNGGSALPPLVYLATNDGGDTCNTASFGGFAAPIALTISGWYRSLDLSDVNGDGVLDVLLGTTGNANEVFLGPADGW